MTTHADLSPSPRPATKDSRVITRSPIYYGWIILLAATFGMVMTIPGQTVGVSVFLDKLIADLNLSRSVVSLMYTFGTLGGALVLPFVGRFIDRRGPRRAVTLIAALFALACVIMGSVQGLVTLLLGFFLIRSLGQGALSLVSLHVINLWFVRRRGLAVGLAGVGMAAGTALFPLFIEFLINQAGWRLAYALLGGLVAITILPLGALLYRERPERFGLAPDGQAAASDEMETSELSLTLVEARRTPSFWLFAIGGFCIAGLSTALIFHHYSIMDARGLDRAVAAQLFVPLGAVMAIANLLTGILMDRLPPRLLLSAMLLLLSTALFLAMRVTSPRLVLLYGGILGLAQGMQGAIGSGVYAHLFGRLQLGAIKGLATTVSVMGAAIGPFLFALGLERFDSYGPVLLLAALLPLLLALGAPFVQPPHKMDRQAIDGAP